MPRFIKGLELSRLYFEQVVKPILENHDKNLNYAAGLIGHGSEVLGFDDSMSTDHDWGPSVTIFLSDDNAHLIFGIDELMRYDLPHHFKGYSTNFIYSPETPDARVMAITTRGAVNHQVKAVTLRDYFMRLLAWDIDTRPDVIDWLTFPSQKLKAVTSGAVFHDGDGDLTHIRARLAWYPDDVWLYLMAAQWNRISEEEHLMGRTGYRGDEIGATIIANRIISDVIRLCFLMEGEYAPYAKWFGTAFQQLDCATALSPMLRQMQLAENWQERETAYAHIVEFMIDSHNQLKITRRLPVRMRKFHTRPFQVADGGTIAAQISAQITDDAVRSLLDLPSPIGSIDQISDETTLKEFVAWREKLRQLYLI